MARTDTLEHFLTDLADGIRQKTGQSGLINPNQMDVIVKEIPTGGGDEIKYTGQVDVEGLKSIGWTDEDIQYFKKNGVRWNEEENDTFLVDEEEKQKPIGDGNSLFLHKNYNKTMSNYDSLIGFPMDDWSDETSMSSRFSGCRSLTTIPLINTSNVTTMRRMFNSCYSLTTIPLIDTSNATSMDSMFYGCHSLTTIPLIDTSKVTTTNSMFYYCDSLKAIPKLDTSSVTNTNSMFNGCRSLTTIPELDTSSLTSMSSMFYECYSLKAIPKLDTSKVTNMNNTFYYCYTLISIPELDASSLTNTYYMFYYCGNLKNLGGFKNLGKSYTQQSKNNTNYKLDLLYSSKLTKQSLLNIINNLYDLNISYNVADGGTLYTQQLTIGSTNLAKLTSEEIAIATNKGWTVS